MTTEKIITSLDQHGRMLIPSNIRERFNISPNDKVTIELTEDALVIRNVDYIINEMNAIFTKNQTVKKENIVEDFIEDKRKDFKIEQARENANE
ncbi:AbrB/MazE/SpoVT family DNA-binding domain-containing protein [Candidatus Bandiella numerosa]|jgi:AbrB family looped-hinge helix DNA binding protein|uniref:AbrB/MazE/SpoVT family DNA-binding domain-containing protein n=1 Tax=Candidatus Bandiella numerosa TaxID=2570586 RepID=UPI00249EA73A|nr:AbrB/MazE/SpoVT family DNA-binding domain-containing protein [Candidatus Bandiella numerosa]WHA04600.1 AbrB/MazE/SpoVT family DNA-binding domain-containing protein [Candidatus Bandiella numerosa]